MHINFNSFNLSLSGGNRFIFELSNRLVKRGHKVTITHCGLKQYHKWFSPSLAEINDIEPSMLQRAFRKYNLTKGKKWYYDFGLALIRHIPDCDVNVATFCMTAIPTYLSGKGRSFYLVQNYEPWFFRESDYKRKVAELSYKFPLTKLCVSQWLVDKVGGVNIGNGINLDVFKQKKPKELGTVKKVMAIKRGIDWKRDDLVDMVFAILKEQRRFKFLVPHNLSDEALVDMYNKADLLVYASSFEGFGYPPLEAMACGTPVVTTDCLEYAKHLQNAYIVPRNTTPTQLAEAAEIVLNTRPLYEKLVDGGLKTALDYDFEKVVDRFESCIGCS